MVERTWANIWSWTAAEPQGSTRVLCTPSSVYTGWVPSTNQINWTIVENFVLHSAVLCRSYSAWPFFVCKLSCHGDNIYFNYFFPGPLTQVLIFKAGENEEIKNYKLIKRDGQRQENVCGWDLAEWLERLTANAVVATILGSIPASSDTVEYEGRQIKQLNIKEKFKFRKCLY